MGIQYRNNNSWGFPPLGASTCNLQDLYQEFPFTNVCLVVAVHCLSLCLSRTINSYIYNQDSVSCGFSFCPLGVKSMCESVCAGEHVSVCDCLDAFHTPAGQNSYWDISDLIGQLSMCAAQAGLEVEVEEQWPPGFPGDSRESDALRSGVEKERRGHRGMRMGRRVHSWNSRIRFPNLCSEMHYDELWPNYRGVGVWGRGMFGREVRSHTVKGWKWVNVKFESRQGVMSAHKWEAIILCQILLMISKTVATYCTYIWVEMSTAYSL